MLKHSCRSCCIHYSPHRPIVQIFEAPQRPGHVRGHRRRHSERPEPPTEIIVGDVQGDSSRYLLTCSSIPIPRPVTLALAGCDREPHRIGLEVANQIKNLSSVISCVI